MAACDECPMETFFFILVTGKMWFIGGQLTWALAECYRDDENESMSRFKAVRIAQISTQCCRWWIVSFFVFTDVYFFLVQLCVCGGWRGGIGGVCWGRTANLSTNSNTTVSFWHIACVCVCGKKSLDHVRCCIIDGGTAAGLVRFADRGATIRWKTII